MTALFCVSDKHFQKCTLQKLVRASGGVSADTPESSIFKCLAVDIALKGGKTYEDTIHQSFH